jgi:uncharacterized membrane protein YjgN (DUF898 family)
MQCYWHEEDKVVLRHSTVRSVYKFHSTLRTHPHLYRVLSNDVKIVHSPLSTPIKGMVRYKQANRILNIITRYGVLSWMFND